MDRYNRPRVAIETELKARVDDPDAVRATLRRLGARLVSASAFEDNLLLDDECGSLFGRGEALRVRTTGGGSILTWKGPRQRDRGVRSREELEVACPDGEGLVVILERLGFVGVFRYQKYRETWELEGAEIVLDETPVGHFLEIEAEEPLVREVVRRLDLPPESVVEESYPTLFRRLLGERGLPPNAMVFDER